MSNAALLIIGLNYARIPLKSKNTTLLKPQAYISTVMDSGPPWMGSLHLPLRLQQLGQRCWQV